MHPGFVLRAVPFRFNSKAFYSACGASLVELAIVITLLIGGSLPILAGVVPKFASDRLKERVTVGLESSTASFADISMLSDEGFIVTQDPSEVQTRVSNLLKRMEDIAGFTGAIFCAAVVPFSLSSGTGAPWYYTSAGFDASNCGGVAVPPTAVSIFESGIDDLQTGEQLGLITYMGESFSHVGVGAEIPIQSGGL